MFDIKPISSEQTYDLRQAVLRAGQPRHTCEFPGDHAVSTVHLGVFEKPDALIAISSLFATLEPVLGSDKTMQIRGMAVDSAWRGQGLGRLLLVELESAARSAGANVLWANSRLSALSFYRRCGYETVGEQFMIAQVGPHIRVAKKLSEQ